MHEVIKYVERYKSLGTGCLNLPYKEISYTNVMICFISCNYVIIWKNPSARCQVQTRCELMRWAGKIPREDAECLRSSSTAARMQSHSNCLTFEGRLESNPLNAVQKRSWLLYNLRVIRTEQGVTSPVSGGRRWVLTLWMRTQPSSLIILTHSSPRGMEVTCPSFRSFLLDNLINLTHHLSSVQHNTILTKPEAFI